MSELPQRKRQRLVGYDYSRGGAYFLTICTEHRMHILGEENGRTVAINDAGIIIEQCLLNMAGGGISVDKYCIMPDHIHLILFIENQADEETQRRTVSEIVQRFKTITTKLYIDGVKRGDFPPFDKRIWQKSFNDRIIRNQKEYREIWQYIDENPNRATKQQGVGNGHIRQT